MPSFWGWSDGIAGAFTLRSASREAADFDAPATAFGWKQAGHEIPQAATAVYSEQLTHCLNSGVSIGFCRVGWV